MLETGFRRTVALEEQAIATSQEQPRVDALHCSNCRMIGTPETSVECPRQSRGLLLVDCSLKSAYASSTA